MRWENLFESGRALFDPNPELYATRRIALWTYGAYCLLGLVGDAIAILKNGISRPILLVIFTAILLSSWIGFGTTLSAGPPTKRKFYLYIMALNSLVLAFDLWSNLH